MSHRREEKKEKRSHERTETTVTRRINCELNEPGAAQGSTTEFLYRCRRRFCERCQLVACGTVTLLAGLHRWRTLRFVDQACGNKRNAEAVIMHKALGPVGGFFTSLEQCQLTWHLPG